MGLRKIRLEGQQGAGPPSRILVNQLCKKRTSWAKNEHSAGRPCGPSRERSETEVATGVRHLVRRGWGVGVDPSTSRV